MVIRSRVCSCLHPLLCTAPGAFGHVVPDMETGYAFRKDMYAKMGVPVPIKAAKKVLLAVRDSANRRIENQQELIAVIERYNLSYT